MGGRPCRYCGVEMTNPRRVQCGADVCRRRFNVERALELRVRHYAATGERIAYRSLAKGACVDCGDLIHLRPSRGNTRCGRCQRGRAARVAGAVHAERARARRAVVPYVGPPLTPPAPPPPAPMPSPVFVMGWCAACGTAFVDRQLQARFCSEVCARRVQRDRRRARKREAYVADVNRREVFERDRWTCRLCGKRVARTKAVPHPKAPVLDHIVPLAAGVEFGGVHAPHNVQTAHFLCNSLKRDLLEQAALF